MALKKVDPFDVAREFIQEATMEQCQALGDELKARYQVFRKKKKKGLSHGDIVSFPSGTRKSSRGYPSIMVGRVDEIGRTRAAVMVPGYATWRVSVTLLDPATAEQVIGFNKDYKWYGETTPRPRRKSKDRQLLEKLFGMER